MVPDFSGLIWMLIALTEAVIFTCGFAGFVFWVMPPIARKMILCKWSKHVPAFIQGKTGKVELCMSDKELPEGIVHYKKKGWFLISKKPYDELTEEEKSEIKPKRGRHPKDVIVEAIVHTPILVGLGKTVFFGSTDSVALSNLTTIAHANLPNVRLLAPIMYSKTQLDALATGNRLEGMKMFGKETTKIVVVAIAVIGVMVTAGMIFWFLSGGFA